MSIQQTIKVGNCTVIIHRPELSAEERAKREKEVCNALQQYGKSLSKKGGDKLC